MRMLIASAFLLLVLGFPRDAIACSCVASGPPCQEFFRADAVFVGTVQQIVPIEGSGHNARSPNSRVRFVVDRPLRGVDGTSIEILTEPSGGMCGHPFRSGERYGGTAGMFQVEPGTQRVKSLLNHPERDDDLQGQTLEQIIQRIQAAQK